MALNIQLFDAHADVPVPSSTEYDKIYILSTDKNIYSKNSAGTVTLLGTGAFKNYTANLTQASTGAPTATVLGGNQIGTIVWARTSAGIYTGTLTGAFTANKTVLMIGSGVTTGQVTIERTSANVVTIRTYDSSFAVADDVLLGTALKIEVYP